MCMHVNEPGRASLLGTEKEVTGNNFTEGMEEMREGEGFL